MIVEYKDQLLFPPLANPNPLPVPSGPFGDRMICSSSRGVERPDLGPSPLRLCMATPGFGV